MFNLSDCTILKGDDIRSLPASNINVSVSSTTEEVTVEFDDSIWPVNWYSSNNEPAIEVVGKFWIAAIINNKWYAAVFDGRRPGQNTKRCADWEFGKDQVRISPMDEGWKPQVGEIVGFFCTSWDFSKRTPITLIKYGTDEVIWKEGDTIMEPDVHPETQVQLLIKDLHAVITRLNILESQLSNLQEEDRIDVAELDRKMDGLILQLDAHEKGCEKRHVMMMEYISKIKRIKWGI